MTDTTPHENEPRHIPLEAVHNLRDLGGLVNHDGQTVRSGLVYRSDQFCNATDADLARVVDELGIRTIIDLRRPDELERFGYFDSHGVAFHHLELKHLTWELFPVRPDREPMPFLAERYTSMLETGAGAIRDSLELMCTDTPLLFHCVAGKDRTGLVAAIALGLLGVPDEDIADDYALTRHGRLRWMAWNAEHGDPNTPVGLEPPAEAMAETLRILRERFGSYEGYARVIGFDGVEKLRAGLLGD